MVATTQSNEIAEFFDVDQFEPGETQMLCGFISVALCFAATPVGVMPSKKPEDVDTDADSWYVEYDGANTSDNHNGMELWQLYQLIAEKGGHFQASSTDVNVVSQWIAQGYPVIVALPESDVFDVQLGRSPYSWDTSLYSHIITATGIAPSGNLLFRDTANVDNPGPREYDCSRLHLISATLFVPSWLSQPLGPTPQVIAPSNGGDMATILVHSTSFLEPNDNDQQVWNVSQKDAPLIPQHAIPQSWLQARWQHGLNFGPPLEPEHECKQYYNSATSIMEQQFAGARASWHENDGSVTWYDSRGTALIWYPN